MFWTNNHRIYVPRWHNWQRILLECENQKQRFLGTLTYFSGRKITFSTACWLLLNYYTHIFLKGFSLNSSLYHISTKLPLILPITLKRIPNLPIKEFLNHTALYIPSFPNPLIHPVLYHCFLYYHPCTFYSYYTGLLSFSLTHSAFPYFYTLFTIFPPHKTLCCCLKFLQSLQHFPMFSLLFLLPKLLYSFVFK